MDFSAILELLEHMVYSRKDEDPSSLVPEAIVRNASVAIRIIAGRCFVLEYMQSTPEMMRNCRDINEMKM